MTDHLRDDCTKLPDIEPYRTWKIMAQLMTEYAMGAHSRSGRIGNLKNLIPMDGWSPADAN
jgi:hypothetical protein